MSALAEKAEIYTPQQNAIAAFDEFRSQLAILESDEAKTIFDYESKQGNQAARSHIRKLASTAVLIDEKRKEIGEESRAFIKAVNDAGNELEAKVRKMIEPHKKAIDEIKQREKDRVDGIRRHIDEIKIHKALPGATSAQIKGVMDQLEAITVDASFQEFMAEATLAKADAMGSLMDCFDLAKAQEERDAELAQLRKDADDRKRKEELEQAAAAAKEQAEEESRQANLRAEKLAADLAQEKIDSEAREKAAEERAKQRAEEEAAQKQRDEEAAQKKRDADLENQKTKHGEIIAALAALGVSEDLARSIIVAIRKGDVPHVKIQY